MLVDLNQQGFSRVISRLNLIVGIDFTASNEWKGRKTFSSQSLHKIFKIHNPYQRAISNLVSLANKLVTETLASKCLQVYAFGFGDSLGRDRDVFTLFDESFSNGLEAIFPSYTNKARTADLGGPSSFAPIIRKSIEVIKENKASNPEFQMTILFLLTDGEITAGNAVETMQAIVDASGYALSIVILGVGDGPWDQMLQLDKYLGCKCKFDNLSFVELNQLSLYKTHSKLSENDLGLRLFMKLPTQFKIIKQLKLN